MRWLVSWSHCLHFYTFFSLACDPSHISPLWQKIRHTVMPPAAPASTRQLFGRQYTFPRHCTAKAFFLGLCIQSALEKGVVFSYIHLMEHKYIHKCVSVQHLDCIWLFNVGGTKWCAMQSMLQWNRLLTWAMHWSHPSGHQQTQTLLKD